MAVIKSIKELKRREQAKRKRIEENLDVNIDDGKNKKLVECW